MPSAFCVYTIRTTKANVICRKTSCLFHSHSSISLFQDILYTALMDYIDGVKKPSFVLWCLKNDGRLHENINEKICAMFANVKVRDDHGYVNGFTQEQISKSNLVLYGGTNNV